MGGGGLHARPSQPETHIQKKTHSLPSASDGFGGQERHSKGSGVNRLDIGFDQQVRRVAGGGGGREVSIALCHRSSYVQKGVKLKLTAVALLLGLLMGVTRVAGGKSLLCTVFFFLDFSSFERPRRRLMTPLTPKHLDTGRTLSVTRRDTGSVNHMTADGSCSRCQGGSGLPARGERRFTSHKLSIERIRIHLFFLPLWPQWLQCRVCGHA